MKPKEAVMFLERTPLNNEAVRMGLHALKKFVPMSANGNRCPICGSTQIRKRCDDCGQVINYGEGVSFEDYE